MRKTIFKRLLVCVLSAGMVFSLGGVAAMAGETDDAGIKTLAAGTVLSSDGGTLESGEYYLDEDITLAEDITIPSGAEVAIDLNGHTLKGTGSNSVITNRGTFTLNDSSGNDSGELTGPTSEDNGVERGGGVCNEGGFTMNGGKICNNAVSFFGAGVYNSGTFTMTGGEISGNTASYGGGVYNSNYGTFTMTGGEISGNTSPLDEGGGVYNSNEVIMTGGKISGNFAAIGGGVYMNRDSCTFIMTGGEINDNSSYDNGAGVCANRGEFTMTDSVISGNSAPYNDSTGGGVYVGSGCTFTMINSEICDNTACYGGGVDDNGTFIMTDSVISGNSAPYNDSTGGGVYVGSSSTFTMSGTITVDDNGCTGTDNNLYLPSDCHIRFAGAVTAGSSVGVTTATKPTAGNPVQITEAESDTNYYEASAQYFFSDERYTIEVNEAGHYLELSYDSSDGTGGSGKTDIVNLNGTWTYTVDGKADYNYTGFASNAYGKWWVDNGVVYFNVNDIRNDSKGAIGSTSDWYYVVGSKVQESYTGVSNFANANGWWYIKNGKVDFSANTVAENDNGWWYVVGGKVSFTDTVAQNQYGWWYITGGKVDFAFSGLGNHGNANGWWYIKNGKVDFSVNTVARNNYGWWYVDGGKVDFSADTVAQNNYGWWYITGGKVDFGFSGLGNHGNAIGWWYIKDGKVDFSVNTVAQNNYGWWYVTGGKVQFGYTGVANYSNPYGWWYIKAGKVDFSYTGTARNDYGTWNVVNGKVQF